MVFSQRPIILFFSLFILFSSVAFAAPVVVDLVDASSGEPLEHVTVNLFLTSPDETVEKVLFTETGSFDLSASQQTYRGHIILDDPVTDAPDYYFNGSLVVEDGTLHVSLLPIAQVRGNVFDHLANLLHDAALDFRCDKVSTIAFPEHTDKYGSFTSYVPVGKCVIAGAENAYVGTILVDTARGDSIELDLSLDDSSSSSNTFWWIILAIIVLGILAFLYSKKERRKPVVRKTPQKKTPRKLTSIMKTLQGSELAIVQLLVDNNNQSTGSAIRHELKIPKTSLARVLTTLERKKIITLERHGKQKKVRLAEWLVKE